MGVMVHSLAPCLWKPSFRLGFVVEGQNCYVVWRRGDGEGLV